MDMGIGTRPATPSRAHGGGISTEEAKALTMAPLQVKAGVAFTPNIGSRSFVLGWVLDAGLVALKTQWAPRVRFRAAFKKRSKKQA